MHALSIHNLQKMYKNGVQALHGIDLAVDEGDFFALLGPNGAGKSTTIGIITSLVKKTAGKVKVFGYDLDSQVEQVKSCIGLVPQEFNFNIFHKVFDIVVNQAGYYGLDRKLAKQRAEHYLKKLELWEKRNSIARELSGGMKRRLMIARALIHEPRLLILDEPTAGVDIEIRRTMWDFLTEVNKQGITIILTTHYLEEAEHLCKNIAIIDNGRIIEHSSMHTLLQKLHLETFILYLSKPIHFIPELNGFNSHLLDETTLEVDVYKEQPMNVLFEALSKQHIEVLSMRNKSNRLEELFLNMTKHHENTL